MSNVPKKPIVSIYTEATPNPETMKFVLNRMLFAQNSADFPTRNTTEGTSELAKQLFDTFDYVKGVFIMNNFVTLTKNTEVDWIEIIPEVREFIRAYIAEGKPIVNTEALEAIQSKQKANTNTIHEDDDETVIQIKELLSKYVQPAVEMDGGSIVFHNYENGKVVLGMQGSCSGCPSSTVTLKAGIEGLLKRMMPGKVDSVEAVAMP